MSDNLYLCVGEVSCFDGDPVAAAAGTIGDPDEAAAAAAATATAAAAAAANDDKTHTDDDVNRIVQDRLARDRKSREDTNKKLEVQLQSVLKSQELTEGERGKLQESLEDVQKQLRTKEEDAKHQLRQVRQKHETELSEAKKSAELWENRFYESSIDRALQDAAASNDAYNSDQVVTLLRPMTKLKPKIDQVTGKETGNFETVIDFPDLDEAGVQVITQRTPEDTVKRMKELEGYANLFKSNVVAGVGATSATGGISPGQNGQVDVRKLTEAQYAKLRKENPASVGL